MHELMTFLLNHEPQVNYPVRDIRGAKDAATWRLTEPQLRARIKAGGHIMFDCSQAVTQICKWIPLDDPNGLGYSTYSNGIPKAYTGSLLAHLRHYTDPGGAAVGAIVVFGPGTGEHSSMVYEPGPDPLLWSHGFDGGPELIRLSAQRARHRSPVTFCNISRL